jgi:pimeloyl-ACP methyl ester carboxylesterase
MLLCLRCALLVTVSAIIYRDKSGHAPVAPRATSRSVENPLVKRPVLLVPGLGGSILTSRVGVDAAAAEERVWVRYTFADSHFSALLGAFNHSSDRYESGGKFVISCPREQNFGLFGVDTLDAGAILPQAFYFHGLIEHLKTAGFEPGRSLFGFCWDWRQRVRSRAVQQELFDRLAHLHDVSGSKVDIVAHSLGALLVRSLLADRPEALNFVASFVSIGAPWRGGGGRTVEGMLVGSTLGNIMISKSTARVLGATSPIAFQVLPDASTGLRLSFLQQGRYVVTSDVFRFLNDTIENETAPFDFRLMRKVERDRDVWMRWRIPARAEPMFFFSVIGVGVATPFDVTFSSDVNEAAELWSTTATPVFSQVDGDGSVPTASALSDGLEAADRQTVGAEHLALLGHEETARHIVRWLDVACSWRGKFRVTDDRRTVEWAFDTSGDERVFNAVRAGDGVRLAHGNVSGLAASGLYDDGLQRIDLRLSLDCATFEGTRVYLHPTPEGARTVRGERVDAGECAEGQASCPIANGFGLRRCVGGAWGPCVAHACRPGFEPTGGVGVASAPRRFTLCSACRESFVKTTRDLSPCMPCVGDACFDAANWQQLLESAALAAWFVLLLGVVVALTVCWPRGKQLQRADDQ